LCFGQRFSLAVLINVLYLVILTVSITIYNISIAMPELLRSAKLAIEKGQSQGRDVSYLKFLTDSIIPALVEALHKVIVIQVHPILNVCPFFAVLL
jgi:hypothetical protein